MLLVALEPEAQRDGNGRGRQQDAGKDGHAPDRVARLRQADAKDGAAGLGGLFGRHRFARVGRVELDPVGLGALIVLDHEARHVDAVALGIVLDGHGHAVGLAVQPQVLVGGVGHAAQRVLVHADGVEGDGVGSSLGARAQRDGLVRRAGDGEVVHVARSARGQRRAVHSRQLVLKGAVRPRLGHLTRRGVDLVDVQRLDVRRQRAQRRRRESCKHHKSGARQHERTQMAPGTARLMILYQFHVAHSFLFFRPFLLLLRGAPTTHAIAMKTSSAMPTFAHSGNPSSRVPASVRLTSCSWYGLS